MKLYKANEFKKYVYFIYYCSYFFDKNYGNVCKQIFSAHASFTLCFELKLS